MKSYKAVIFDIDGTMLDTASMNILPLQQVLKKELGKQYSYKELEPYVAYSGTVILDKLGIPKSENARVLSEWIQWIQESGIVSTPYEGIEDVLIHLKQQKVLLGIVSSKEIKQYQFDIIQKGYDVYFDAVVLADDTERHKPHPDPMLECFRRLQVQAEDVLYIGDTDADAICAKVCGCDFAYASWGPLALQEPCTYILKKPIDILALWEQK